MNTLLKSGLVEGTTSGHDKDRPDALYMLILDVPHETVLVTDPNVPDGVSRMTGIRESRSRDWNYPVQINKTNQTMYQS